MSGYTCLRISCHLQHNISRYTELRIRHTSTTSNRSAVCTGEAMYQYYNKNSLSCVGTQLVGWMKKTQPNCTTTQTSKTRLKLTQSNNSKNLKRNVGRDKGVNQVDKHLAELDVNRKCPKTAATAEWLTIKWFYFWRVRIPSGNYT